MGKIIEGHTFDEYQEKYGKKFNDGKLQFVNLTDKDKLYKKKNYWEIKNGSKPGYYEISNKRWLIPIIVFGSIAAITVAVVPAVLLTRPQPTPPGPVVEYCDFKFTGTNCQIKVGEEYKQEHTFSLEKGKKPTETYNIVAEDEYEVPENLDVPSIVKYEKKDERNATIVFNDKINENVAIELTAPLIENPATLNVKGENCKVIVRGISESSHTFYYAKGSKPTETISLVADDNYSFPESQKGLPNIITYTTISSTSATLVFNDAINTNVNVDIKGHKRWYHHTNWWDYCSNGVEEEQATTSDVGREVNLTVNNQIHKVRLIGIDHDNLANGNGKAHCTFEFSNLLCDSDGYSLATVWNWEHGGASSNYNFLNSNLRKALDGGGDASLTWYQKGSETQSSDYKGKTVLNMLPENLRSQLKTVNKPIAIYADDVNGFEVNSYSTKLFLLSYSEMTEANDILKEGSTYVFYTESGDTDANRIKHQLKWHDGAVTSAVKITDGEKPGDSFNCGGYNSTTESYGGYLWLRSPCTTSNRLAWHVRCDGSINNYGSVHYHASAIAPAFCI